MRDDVGFLKVTNHQNAILVVEDDTFKLDRIMACLSRARFTEVDTVRSVQAAVARLGERQYEFICLDMSLPSHDLKPGGSAGASLLSGGMEIIMELSFLKRTDAVIVLTQYPEIEIEGELIPIAGVHRALREMFETNTVGVIQYRHESTAWEDEVLSALEQKT